MNETAKLNKEYSILLDTDLNKRNYEKAVLLELFNLASKTQEDLEQYNLISDCYDMLKKLPGGTMTITFAREDIINLKIGFKNSTTKLGSNVLIMRNDTWIDQARSILKQIGDFKDCTIPFQR
jgi:hypothetical protein